MRFPVFRALTQLAAAGSIALLLAAPSVLHAQSLSFRSSDAGYRPFVFDNDVQLFALTTTDASDLITVSTDSYADAALNGFPTALSLFTDTGQAETDALIGQSVDDTGLNDATLRAVVPAGSYWVALTQHDNAALGPNRSDGYAFNSAAFSDPQYTGGPFLDFDGSTRTGSWQVTVNAAPVPEAGTGRTFLLSLLLLAGSTVARRRTRTGKLKGEANG